MFFNVLKEQDVVDINLNVKHRENALESTMHAMEYLNVATVVTKLLNWLVQQLQVKII